MEQKKTLWIALSTGVFLLFVLGAAVFIYSPMAKSDNSAIAMRESGQVWTAGLPSQAPSQGALIANKDESSPVSGIYTPSSDIASTGSSSAPSSVSGQEGVLKTDNVTVITDTANVYAKESVSTGTGSAPSVSYNVGTGTSTPSTVTGTNKKGEQAIMETGNQKKVEESKASKPAPATPAKAVAKTSSSSGSGTAKAPASAAKSSSSSASSKASISPVAHYWVQVASYSTKDNADEARKVLDSKDFPCEVFTFTKDSKLYYRVRVGPYKTESEAEKWKKNVDAIDMFKTAQSYVVDSSARASR